MTNKRHRPDRAIFRTQICGPDSLADVGARPPYPCADTLESRGIVRRHHGGAHLSTPTRHEEHASSSNQSQADQKFAIAVALPKRVERVRGHLDGGTTPTCSPVSSRKNAFRDYQLAAIASCLEKSAIPNLVTGEHLGRLAGARGALWEASFNRFTRISRFWKARDHGSAVECHRTRHRRPRKMSPPPREHFRARREKLGRKPQLTAPLDSHDVVTDTPPHPWRKPSKRQARTHAGWQVRGGAGRMLSPPRMEGSRAFYCRR